MSVQHLGIWRNICSVLGNSPLFWCWPIPAQGTGLKYELAEGDGKWIELNTRAFPNVYMNGHERPPEP